MDFSRQFILKRDQIWVLIAKCEKRINRLLSGGTTLILVSHSMADIKKYCNRVVKIDHGHIVADGPTEEVLGV